MVIRYSFGADCVRKKTGIIILLTALAVTAALSSFEQASGPQYPKVVGYMSYMNPVIAFDKNGSTVNFKHAYSGAFPCGINIIKSGKFGFSFEFAPFITVTGSHVKMNNLLFHPGLLLRYPNGFTIATRLAFETQGRFGATANFSKVVAVSKMVSYFVAIPVPVRFGNDKPCSLGIAVQGGVIF